MTLTETDIRTNTDEDLDTESGKAAHIVKTKPGENAAAKVLEARVLGISVEALCGVVFVPQRDPKQLPMCQKRKEIYQLYRMDNEHLNENPTT